MAKVLHKSHHSQSQASSTSQSPTLERWLDEGRQDAAEARGKLKDRDGYPKGEGGMRKYLNNWNGAWHGVDGKAAGQRKI